jgi:hypothetical protein
VNNITNETKLEVWLQLARPKYPTLSEDKITALSLTAANDWFFNTGSELADLYDQYVMLKTLKGIELDGD